MRTEQEIREMIAQHGANLALWQNGFLNPTEPELEERAAVMRELKAAIWTLQWVLDGKGYFPPPPRPPWVHREAPPMGAEGSLP